MGRGSGSSPALAFGFLEENIPPRMNAAFLVKAKEKAQRGGEGVAPSQKPGRWAYFVSSFTLTFLVLGAFTGVMVIYLLTGDFGGETAPEQVGASVYIPRESDNLTVFSAVEAGQDIFLLMHYNPIQGRISILSLPPQLLAEEPPSPKTLQEVYETGGVTAARTALERLLGVSIDRHMVMDRQGFLEIAEAFGPVEYTLGEELSLSADAGGVVLRAGRQRLDGATLLRLMEYQGYDGGEPSRIKAIAELAAAAVNQKLGLVSGDQGEELFRRAVNQIKTDLSFVDFDARLSSARMMAELKASPAQVIPAEGRYNQAQDMFALSEGTNNRVKDQFR